MNLNATVVLTFQSIETILGQGGTRAWRLVGSNARKRAFAVCTRNAMDKRVQGSEPHRSAFLVGKVKDVVPVPGREKRYLLQFSEYARVNIPNVWKKGDRNPVKYASLEQLGIDPSKLKWEPMPEPSAVPLQTFVQPACEGLTITAAKQGLSLTLGVPVEAIEITIRG